MSEQSDYGKKIWLDFYEKGVKKSVDFQDTLIPQYLEESAKTFPEKSALIFQGFTMTFRELDEMVARFSAALKGFGIKKGDSVAILLPNVIPCVVAYYATLRIGAIVVLNNPLYADRELEHQFNDSKSTFLITLDLLANRMVKLREKTAIKTIVYTSIGDYLPFVKRLLFPLVAKKKGLAADVAPADNLYKFKDVIAQNSPDYTQADVNIDDVAMYQYTGGTTGVSKGVMLTHKNISYQIQQAVAWFPTLQKGKEIMLGALPIFHVFGMTVSMNFAIKMGWPNVLVPKPQPEPLLEAISKFKVTFAPLVPTMYIGMLDHPDLEHTDLTSIRGCFSGSAPLPLDIINNFQEKDRIKDMIISGGYNVYPRDIDEVLFEHPKILEACCIGIPHEKRGEAIKAFVILKEGETMTDREVIEYCKTKLATYKLPTVVEFKQELPKSNVGKILRKDLRKMEEENS